TEQPADSRDSRIVLGRLDWPGECFGIRSHRTELQRLEHTAALPDASLRKKDRTSVLELDGDWNQQPERRGEGEAGSGERCVEEPLDHAAVDADAGRLRLANRS